MEEIVKSEILRRLSDSIERNENLEIYAKLKKTASIVKISMKIEEQETFVDKNGVKWVRDS